MLKTSCLLLEQRLASAFRRIVEGRPRLCQPFAALTSSRLLAEGSGCTNCAVSKPFTLHPTTVVIACLTSGC